MRIVIWLRNVVIVASILVATQSSLSGDALENRRPKTAAERLSEYHIGLTKVELLAALKNSSADIRALAATQLSDVGAKDAIPYIAESLVVEKEPLAKVNIAYALTMLGDERGTEALAHTCIQHDTPSGIRFLASRYLLSVDNTSCLGAVLDSIDRATKSEERLEAVSALQDFHDFSKEEFERVNRALLYSLRDRSAAVRIAASDALAKLGGKSDIPNLNAALLKEKDSVVISHMHAALRRLQDGK